MWSRGLAGAEASPQAAASALSQDVTGSFLAQILFSDPQGMGLFSVRRERSRTQVMCSRRTGCRARVPWLVISRSVWCEGVMSGCRAGVSARVWTPVPLLLRVLHEATAHPGAAVFCFLLPQPIEPWAVFSLASLVPSYQEFLPFASWPQ